MVPLASANRKYPGEKPGHPNPASKRDLGISSRALNLKKQKIFQDFLNKVGGLSDRK
jgi:hypothetical protein